MKQSTCESALGQLDVIVTYPNCDDPSSYHAQYTDGTLLIEGDVLNNQLMGIWHISTKRRKLLSFAMLNEDKGQNTVKSNGFPLDRQWWESANVRYIGYQPNDNVAIEGHISNQTPLGIWQQYSTKMDTLWKGKFIINGTKEGTQLDNWPYPILGSKNGEWVAFGSRNIPLDRKCFAKGSETPCPDLN